MFRVEDRICWIEHVGERHCIKSGIVLGIEIENGKPIGYSVVDREGILRLIDIDAFYDMCMHFEDMFKDIESIKSTLAGLAANF